MTEICQYFFKLPPEPSSTIETFMPELPELQAFSRNLSKRLAGKEIEKLHAMQTRNMKTSGKALNTALKGAVLSSVHREGKELRFFFDNERVLGLHLMLKGQLHLFEGENDRKPAILEMYFTDRTGLAVIDYQKQATAILDPEPPEAPDALSVEVTSSWLGDKLRASRSSVKKLLMDQKVIRGIGNAYADEILWHARISPFSACARIPEDAVDRLAANIKEVLKKAEKDILKENPDIITGESRDFLAIHNPARTQSPTGAKIHIETSGTRKTYYTDEQVHYK